MPVFNWILSNITKCGPQSEGMSERSKQTERIIQGSII